MAQGPPPPPSNKSTRCLRYLLVCLATNPKATNPLCNKPNKVTDPVSNKPRQVTTPHNATNPSEILAQVIGFMQKEVYFMLNTIFGFHGYYWVFHIMGFPSYWVCPLMGVHCLWGLSPYWVCRFWFFLPYIIYMQFVTYGVCRLMTSVACMQVFRSVVYSMQEKWRKTRNF